MDNPFSVDQDDEQSSIRSSPVESSSEEESESQESQESRAEMKIRMAAFASYHTLGALEILRESVAALRAISPIFTWLAILVATPFSAILLSQQWLLAPLHQALAARIQRLVRSRELWFSPSVHSLLLKLSENLISHAFQLPFYILLALPARAAISSAIVSLHYSSTSTFDLRAFLRLGAPRMWARGVITCLWICALMLACISTILILLVLLTTIFHSADLSPDLLLLLLAAIALGFSLLFAHLVIISNLAITISILEQLQGRVALMKAILILRGRAQVGLLLFIISTGVTAAIDGLFQYRVIGVPGYNYGISLESKLWEVPLLLAMHSFFNLFDAIPSTIFYFTCKSACCEILDSFSLCSEFSSKV